MWGVFALIFTMLFNNVWPQESIFCTEGFCDSYLAKETCIKIPEACKIQNVTHNGLFLPHPGPCNCCDYCLENQASGDDCSIGDPSYPTPTLVCGAGLSCQPTLGKDQTTCQTMNTSCTRDQEQYDIARNNGDLGHLQERAVCDAKGMYAPYSCIPGEICYCVSEDGRRIFGEIPYTSQPEHQLKCGCSRHRDEFLQLNNIEIFHNQLCRCQSNGDYDTIQCIDEQCLCVDPEDGHPTYPNKESVNVTLISAVNLPCFKDGDHKEAEYYRDCEEEYVQQTEIINEYREQGFDVYGYVLPNCQPDGYYSPVQQSKTMKYCAGPTGEVLENFEVSLTDPLSTSMNCKCARTRNLMRGGEKPVCCKNGNYQKLQCRRGLCRCVDENGMQIEKEVEYIDREKLMCFSNMCTFD